MNGWMGKILRVDLTSGALEELDTGRYAEKYLGGRGIASRLYWEKVTPDVGAFSPDNRLIFMSGPLLATGAQGAARMCVAGKSPMAYPEGYCYGSLGGMFPAELKKAGWDGFVLDGAADAPVCLVIEDGAVAVKDAEHLWGLSAYEVRDAIAAEYGERAAFVTTGIAGENRVRTAIIFASQEGSVTAGFGAVMASKNVKAVVVKGSGRVAVADRKRLVELAKYTIELRDTCDLSVVPRIGMTQHGHLLETKGGRHCYFCGLTCSKYIYRMGKDPALQGLRGCQAMEYYLPWMYGREDEPVKTLFDAPTLANDYSIGTFELQGMVDWLWNCYQKGVYTDEDTGLPLSKIGTREFLEKLLHAIAHREGFGDVLAEGMMRVRDKVAPEAAALVPHSAAPVGTTDGLPPRSHLAHGLIYPFETRMHPISVHEMGYVRLAWRTNLQDPSQSNVTPEVYVDIARKFWGGEAAADETTYEGKAAAARNIQNRSYLRDSLGLCDFVYPMTYSFSKYGPTGDPDLEGNVYEAVTGRPAAELPAYAERIFNMQRLIRVREGHRVPGDDYPPEFNFTEPILSNIHDSRMVKPGPGGRPVPAAGGVLDREKFKQMLLEYYELRGWDKTTGLPTEATLRRLGMDDLIGAEV
jgi:aldehyde:ferredoxin oxidoreductase